jgi:hypothetical protein
MSIQKDIDRVCPGGLGLAALLAVALWAGWPAAGASAQYAWTYGGGWRWGWSGYMQPQLMAPSSQRISGTYNHLLSQKWELPRRVGTYVDRLPGNPTRLRLGEETYFQVGADFFRAAGEGFVVVVPPIGGVLERAPLGADEMQIQGTPFFYYAGAFVRKGPAGFEVVPAPEGAVVRSLPPGYAETTIDGKRHYVCAGTLYRPYARGAEIVYKVVKPPAPAPAPAGGAGKQG